jgi:hypothetical protein
VNFANVLVAVKKDQTAKVSSLTRFTVPLLLARQLPEWIKAALPQEFTKPNQNQSTQ